MLLSSESSTHFFFIVIATQDTLQAAKRTFLTSTETKSPLKRPLTPEPDLEEEVKVPFLHQI